MVINVILPVMLVLLVGYIFGRFTDVDPSPISKLAITVLSPALIFSFLVRNSLSSKQMIQIVSSVLVFTLIMTILTIVIIKWTGNRSMLTPSLLSTVFPNTGNYGLPIVMFAYGESAFALSVVIVVINFILMYSLGIYFALLSGDSWKQALRNIIKLPTSYATMLAILVNLFSIEIPNFVYDPIKMVGQSMIPLALLLLGIQLSRTNLKGHLSATIISSALKIIAAPIVIFAIVYTAGIDGTIAKVLILLNSMPTAVVMTIIAAEYKSGADMVANVTLLTTLTSFFSITTLLYLLNIIYG
ncbi:AEC family transporter [Fictibacillus enclensis]|uniref:AEC family transporter n=1 Tax=Fictibacillus enclensis TaxID=1017270 RepID=UPI0025A0CCE6|nr:AEC family transporter [Fictibacillus enclensis]MDM5196566.1 AEC family transporter [Fictibacillus enclensis]